jgi:2-phospho-L-lactate/phosphoenolpyruvate guanylyltransferase
MTWAVVVARCGPTAKSRLAPVLGQAERGRLALSMLADVLDAAAAAPLAGAIAVVDTEPAGAVARAHGALVVPDPGAGMNGAVRAGVAAAGARDATGVLVLPGDIPLVGPDDLAAVVAAAGAGGPVVVVNPDRQGVGTNALLVRPPTAIRPAFGLDSARHHLYRARVAGIAARTVRRERLGFDVDLPADLAELRQSCPGGATGALLRNLREHIALS